MLVSAFKGVVLCTQNVEVQAGHNPLPLSMTGQGMKSIEELAGHAASHRPMPRVLAGGAAEAPAEPAAAQLSSSLTGSCPVLA